MPRKPMYKRYANRKPIGTFPLVSTFGMVVYEPDEFDNDGSCLVCAWEIDGEKQGFHRHKVFTADSGRQFLRKGSFRFYLDEIIRL